MTGGSDPTVWSAGEQAAAIRSRRLSSEELLDLFLARIAAVDPQVNAVCTLAVDPARERCREADAATIDGQSWGPLHGLPITIKDAIATAGIRSTGGATALRDHVPVTDAPAVARRLLRRLRGSRDGVDRVHLRAPVAARISRAQTSSASTSSVATSSLTIGTFVRARSFRMPATAGLDDLSAPEDTDGSAVASGIENWLVRRVRSAITG